MAGHQTWYIKNGSRFFNNNAIASMGYGLPAAIGACVANKRKMTICLEGDGSIMMNLQELQTIVTNQLPIKIILCESHVKTFPRENFVMRPVAVQIKCGIESFFF